MEGLEEFAKAMFKWTMIALVVVIIGRLGYEKYVSDEDIKWMKTIIEQQAITIKTQDTIIQVEKAHSRALMKELKDCK